MKTRQGRKRRSLDTPLSKSLATPLPKEYRPWFVTYTTIRSVSTRQWMLESNDATSTEKQWTTKLGSRQQSVIAWAGNIASRWSALEVVAPAGPAPHGWPDPDDMCVRLICSISRLVVSHTVVRSALHRCPTSLRSLSADVEFVVRLSTKVPPAAFFVSRRFGTVLPISWDAW